MAINSFIANLKENFRRGDIVTQLLYINVGMFILTALTGIVLILFRLPPVPWLNCRHGLRHLSASPGRC